MHGPQEGRKIKVGVLGATGTVGQRFILLLAEHPYFDPIKTHLDELLNPTSFIGRAPEQVDKFLTEWVQPALASPELQAVLAKGEKAELNV